MKIEIALTSREIEAINLAAIMSRYSAERYEETHPDDDLGEDTTYNNYVFMEDTLNRIYYSYINQLALENEMNQMPKRLGTRKNKTRKSFGIGWNWYEMMKNMFFSLLKQAGDDSEESYEKMISWIRHIPENAPFSFDKDELGCFDFAVMQSVPVEDEDALELDDQ